VKCAGCPRELTDGHGAVCIDSFADEDHRWLCAHCCKGLANGTRQVAHVADAGARPSDIAGVLPCRQCPEKSSPSQPRSKGPGERAKSGA